LDSREGRNKSDDPLDSRDGEGLTPLHLALDSREGRNKSDDPLDIRDGEGLTPLHLAALQGRCDVVLQLLSLYEPFLEARVGTTIACTTRLDSRSQLLAQDRSGLTALHYSCVRMVDNNQCGNYYVSYNMIIGALLFHGASVFEKDKHGNTPLHYAVMKHTNTSDCDSVFASVSVASFRDVIRSLLRHGSDISSTNNNGRSPESLAKNDCYVVDLFQAVRRAFDSLNHERRRSAASTTLTCDGHTISKHVMLEMFKLPEYNVCDPRQIDIEAIIAGIADFSCQSPTDD
jgi:ankyrin repeat protein